MEAVFFNIPDIIEDIDDRREERKDHKAQYGDREGAEIKKAEAEKEGDEDEEVFDVMVEAQESGVILKSA
jgi:hypothetical protein